MRNEKTRLQVARKTAKPTLWQSSPGREEEDLDLAHQPEPAFAPVAASSQEVIARMAKSDAASRQRLLGQLQRTHGNSFVQRVVDEYRKPSPFIKECFPPKDAEGFVIPPEQAPAKPKATPHKPTTHAPETPKPTETTAPAPPQQQQVPAPGPTPETPKPVNVAEPPKKTEDSKTDGGVQVPIELGLYEKEIESKNRYLKKIKFGATAKGNVSSKTKDDSVLTATGQLGGAFDLKKLITEKGNRISGVSGSFGGEAKTSLPEPLEELLQFVTHDITGIDLAKIKPYGKVAGAEKWSKSDGSGKLAFEVGAEIESQLLGKMTLAGEMALFEYATKRKEGESLLDFVKRCEKTDKGVITVKGSKQFQPYERGKWAAQAEVEIALSFYPNWENIFADLRTVVSDIAERLQPARTKLAEGVVEKGLEKLTPVEKGAAKALETGAEKGVTVAESKVAAQAAQKGGELATEKATEKAAEKGTEKLAVAEEKGAAKAIEKGTEKLAVAEEKAAVEVIEKGAAKVGGSTATHAGEQGAAKAIATGEKIVAEGGEKAAGKVLSVGEKGAVIAGEKYGGKLLTKASGKALTIVGKGARIVASLPFQVIQQGVETIVEAYKNILDSQDLDTKVSRALTVARNYCQGYLAALLGNAPGVGQGSGQGRGDAKAYITQILVDNPGASEDDVYAHFLAQNINLDSLWKQIWPNLKAKLIKEYAAEGHTDGNQRQFEKTISHVGDSGVPESNEEWDLKLHEKAKFAETGMAGLLYRGEMMQKKAAKAKVEEIKKEKRSGFEYHLLKRAREIIPLMLTDEQGRAILTTEDAKAYLLRHPDLLAMPSGIVDYLY